EERLQETIPADEKGLLRFREKIRQWVHLATDPERAQGTVNFIARDREGNLCCGVSTSGWAWKYPGRLGDSPVIGAGNYADNRYGAAACTGRGEMAIRTAAARSLVLYLKMGMTLQEAATEVMREVESLVDPYHAALHLIAVDREGNHVAMSNRPGNRYVYWVEGMPEPCLAPREHFVL
ncbi:MAG: asparaginase, partial [Nitrospinota bacterium]